MNNKNKQMGYTLIEIIAVLALAGLATALSFANKAAQMEQDRAQALGNDLFHYSNAVRQFLANNPDTPEILGIEGSNWLKDKSECLPADATGYGDKAYLPCRFKEATSDKKMFGDTYLTTDIRKSGEQTNITIKVSPLVLGDRPRPDLSGLAAMSAAAGSYVSSNGSMLSTYGAFHSDIKTAEITIEINNGIEGDIWIRVDNPVFKKSAYFDPDNPREDRELRNVSRIQSLANEILRIGRDGGALNGDSVIVDADLTSLGNIIGLKNLEIANDISAGGSARISGDLSVKGEINSSGNISSAGHVQAEIFYDTSGKSYYLQPGKESKLKSLQTEKVKLTAARDPGTQCEEGEIARMSDGVIMSCVKDKLMINASWVNGIVTPGSSCVPGSFAFDSSNNLYVCR